MKSLHQFAGRTLLPTAVPLLALAGGNAGAAAESGNRVEIALSHLLAAWRASRPQTILRHLKASLSTEVVFADGSTVLNGAGAICEYIVDVHQSCPTLLFAVGDVICHGPWAHYRWSLLDADGDLHASGAGVVELSTSGEVVAWLVFRHPKGAV